MSFGLYGKPFRKINKPQLINSINNRNLVVEIEFEVNNHSYRIIRGMKPNVFEVWEDGTMLDQEAKILDYQTYLENDVLGMNYITFTQLIVLGKATHTPFMQLPVMKRRQMIEHLLGITVFYEIGALIKEKVKAVNYDLIVSSDHLSLELEKLSMNEKYQKNTSQDKQKLISDLTDQIDAKEKESEKCKIDSHIHEDTIEKLTQKYDNDLDAEIKKHANRKRDILNKIKDIEKNTNFFQHNDDCPTCTQFIDEDIKRECIANNDILLGKLQTGNEVNEDKLLELSRMYDINTSIWDSISVSRTSLGNNITLIRRIKNEIANLQNNIQTYKSDDSDKNRDISIDIDINNQNINKFEKRIASYKELLDYYEIMAVMLDDDGVKSLIIKKYLPIFNRDINNYLHKFGLNVQFILDEQFNETILSRGRDNFSYNSFSEGQKLRIDLALMMSFRNLCKIKNSVDSNLLIMDEIFDSSLNQKGVDAFVDMLTEQEDIHTFVITHTPEKIHDRFENTIEVRLLNNFSEIRTIGNVY